MVSIVVNQGLSMTGQRASGVAGAGAAIVTGAVDDATGTTLAAHTKLNDAAGFTQVFAQAFDSTPTEAAQVVTHIWTLATGSANFTHRRASLHNTAAGSTTGASTGLMSAVDGFALTKTSSFSMKYTFKHTYSSI